MSQKGLPFETALTKAQQLGYAEPIPDNDTKAFDSTYKIAILASLGFGLPVMPDIIYREGIDSLNIKDFRYAAELGYSIKLLAIAKETNQKIEVRVHPAMIPNSSLLSQVNGVFNAIQVEGDLTGPVILFGRGAGPGPTSSAIIADIINISQSLAFKGRKKLNTFERKLTFMPMGDIQTRYYIRIQVIDNYGVLAEIARILGKNQISIASVVQKEISETLGTAELVIMTHKATESSMQQALVDFRNLTVLHELSSFIRVED